MEKKDQKTLMVLLALVCVAGVVAYRSFFQKKEGPRVAVAAKAIEVNLPDTRQAIAVLRSSRPMERMPYRPVARDLFSPLIGTDESGSPNVAVQTEDLTVEGIMLGDGEAFATINGVLYKVGDPVVGYVVASISEEHVLLRKGTEELILELSE